MQGDLCLAEFRVKKGDVPVLAEALQIPEIVRCEQRSVCKLTVNKQLYFFLFLSIAKGVYNFSTAEFVRIRNMMSNLTFVSVFWRPC